MIDEALNRLLSAANDFDASDLHLVVGVPPAYRVNGEIIIADEDALDEEIRLQTHCFLTEDCAEGLAAFFEKRKPNFHGH